MIQGWKSPADAVFDTSYDFHTHNVACDHGKTRKLDASCMTSSIKKDGHEYERRLRVLFLYWLRESIFVLYGRKLHKRFSHIPIFSRFEGGEKENDSPMKYAWHIPEKPSRLFGHIIMKIMFQLDDVKPISYDLFRLFKNEIVKIVNPTGKTNFKYCITIEFLVCYVGRNGAFYFLFPPVMYEPEARHFYSDEFLQSKLWSALHFHWWKLQKTRQYFHSSLAYWSSSALPLSGGFGWRDTRIYLMCTKQCKTIIL